MIENFNVVFYTTLFIVPGYILYSTLETLIPRSKKNFIDSSMKFLTATLAHYIIWFWPILFMFSNKLYESNLLFFYLTSVVIIFISPCIIGLIIAKMNKYKVITRALQFYGYNPLNPIPTGWDYVFSKMTGKTWVIVTLKNQKVFHGKFSTNSYASSDINERDIYIEDVYTINEDESWSRKERNKGVLILKNEILSIELFDND